MNPDDPPKFMFAMTDRLHTVLRHLDDDLPDLQLVIDGKQYSARLRLQRVQRDLQDCRDLLIEMRGALGAYQSLTRSNTVRPDEPAANAPREWKP